MKIRSGFVSNSSSSSFVCDICGYSEEVYDGDMSESGLFQCEHGHTVCVDHLTHNFPDLEIEYQLVQQGDHPTHDYDPNAMPISCCPICQLRVLSKEDLLAFLLKSNGLTPAKVLQNVIRQFGSYKEFKNSLT